SVCEQSSQANRVRTGKHAGLPLHLKIYTIFGTSPRSPSLTMGRVGCGHSRSLSRSGVGRGYQGAIMLQTMDNLSPELAPELEQTGITLRRWRDAADFEPMARVLYASHQADGIEEARTAQDLAQMYGTFKNFDPTRDLLLVEHAGELVAYSGSRWWEEHTHDFVHPLWLAIVPEWRGRGLEYELLR